MDLENPNSQNPSARLIRVSTKTLMTLFIIWHGIGISIVGPAYPSYMRDGLMQLYSTYLSTIHLDKSWPFYAPDPFLGSLLHYETVSTDGATATYPLSHANDKFDHAYFRYTNFYAYLFYNEGYTQKRGYDQSVARYLCSRHSSNVVSINFILQTQSRFSYNNYLEGYRPLDSNFITSRVIGPYQC